MNENDNILIEQFFREAAVQQIEDNGFSERVMVAIGAQKRSTLCAQRLWTLFCIAVAVVVFFYLQDLTALVTQVVVFLTNVEVFLRILPTSFDLSMLTEGATATPLLTILLSLVVLMVLSVIGLTRWVSRWVW